MDTYEELYYAERRRRYRLEVLHEEDVIAAPFVLVLVSMLLSFLWKCFLYIAALVVLGAVIFFLAKWLRKKKRMRFAEVVILSREEAQKGICLRVHIDNLKVPLTLDVTVPEGVSDGQTLALRNVDLKQFFGKKDIYFRVKIQKEDCR